MIDKIYCTIRKEHVSALPEEIVRQQFLAYMIQEKGYPSSLISVEKALRQLPHLIPSERQKAPDRRADILCFARDLQGCSLYPLLLVECKAVKLSPSVINQVVGYNHHVRSCFVAVVNHEEVKTGWFDRSGGEYVFINDLPSHQELLQSIDPG